MVWALAFGSVLSCAGRDDGSVGAEEGAIERTAETERPGPPHAADRDEATEQLDRDAANDDLDLIAAARGWTREQAELYQAKSEAMDEIVHWLNMERAEVYIGGALGPEPEDAPRVYIEGPADAELLARVAEAPVEIQVVDQQPYGPAELDERQSLLNSSLIELGFDNFATSYDIQREGRLQTEVTRKDGAPQTVDEIRAALPASIRSDVDIEIWDEPVVIDE